MLILQLYDTSRRFEDAGSVKSAQPYAVPLAKIWNGMCTHVGFTGASERNSSKTKSLAVLQEANLCKHVFDTSLESQRLRR